MSTAELERPELRIEPKRQVAADLGVSTEALVRTRSASRRSATSTPISPSSTPATGWCRSASSSTSRRARASACCRSLRVPTVGGATTPLSVVADFSISHGPTAINRYDRSRRVTIEADLHGDAALGDAVDGDPRAADRQEPAARRRDPRDRRRRGHERGVRLLRRGDGRRPDDGLRPARAAVRQFPAADHHPASRCRCRSAARSSRCSSPTRRSRCRSSSAS